MRTLRMLTGALALAAPTIAFHAALYGALPWPAWAGLALACASVLATMR
jgi:hypothetical protein